MRCKGRVQNEEMQHAVGSMRCAGYRGKNAACGIHHAGSAYRMKHAACSMHCTGYRVKHAACGIHHAGSAYRMKHTACGIHHARVRVQSELACSMQGAWYNMPITQCNGTEWSMQHTACLAQIQNEACRMRHPSRRVIVQNEACSTHGVGYRLGHAVCSRKEWCRVQWQAC
jgi:hemin uptake protein HemP